MHGRRPSASNVISYLNERRLVLHRDEITHRDFWRSEKSLLCDVSDFPWPRKSLIYDYGDVAGVGKAVICD